MMHVKGVIAILCFMISVYECRNFCDGKRDSDTISVIDLDEPLFLTPYIENGKIKTAQKLSRCGNLPDVPFVESYSGLITVNKKYNSNLFFWFFPAMNKDKNAPIMLWLQGGPGASSLFGVFTEHGPYYIQANITAALREIHWAKTFHMIYVDNPVGSGFSFTDDERGYARNQEDMAEDLYEFLQQFFTLFPEYQKNDFYVAGESYGGKWVPAIAHKIHTMGKSAKMTLKGISVGNGMVDPETMMNYSEYLYTIGLIDGKQAKVMKILSEAIVSDIQNGDYYDAVVGMNKLIIKLSVFSGNSLYHNFTGLNYYYNFLLSEIPQEFLYSCDYIQTPQFRNAVHVGDLPFHNSKNVTRHLLLDIMRSAKPNITVVMNNYRVLIYNGQLDIIIPYVLTVNFLKTIDWKYAEEYENADRKLWYLKNSTDVAGYVHNVKDFYEIMVRNVGHILPYDNPAVGFDLISRFLKQEPYA